MSCINHSTEEKSYKHFAYLVVRDSIAFYFGIPKFLEEENLKEVLKQITEDKIRQAEFKKGADLNQKEYNKCINSARRSLSLRVKELEKDLERCEDVLFRDNHWLQLLDLDESFFKGYFAKLDQATKDSLAVVPKFKTRDHSLGRSYINDNFLEGVEF
jgi:hypothetical protein